MAALALVTSLVALTGLASTGAALAGRTWGSSAGLHFGSAAAASTRGAGVTGRLTKLSYSVSLTGREAGGLSTYRLAAGAGRTAGATTGGVPVGTKPAIPVGAKRLGAYPTQSPLSLDVVLRGRDPAELTRLATAVSTPGSGDYRHFLPPGRFASEFGATAAEISAVRAELARAGIAAGTVTDGFLLSVHALPSQVRVAFGVNIDRYRLPGGRMAFANTSAPRMAAAVAGTVNGVIGLDDLHLAQPAGLLHGKFHPRAHPLTIGSAAGAAAPCSAANKTANNSAGWTANALAKAYSFNGLYSRQDFGAGSTVALYELEPYAPSDIAAYQKCYGTNVPITNVAVDGGSGTGPGSGEAVLDIEGVIGLAPGIKMLVYSAPNSNTGAVDEYAQIVSQDKADVMSSSWGQCELFSSSSVLGADYTMFAQAAVQGQTMLGAGGDSGSEGCLPNDFNDIPLSAGAGADGVAVDPGTGTAYVVAAGSSSKPAEVTVFSESSGNTVGQISLNASANPEGVAVDTKTHDVFIGLEGSGQVAVLHGATCNAEKASPSGCQLSAINLGSGTKPIGIAANQNTGTVYVAENGRDLVRVIADSSTPHLLGTSIGTAPYPPFAVTVDTTHNWVYFTLIPSGTGGVARVNGANCDASKISAAGCVPKDVVTTGSEPAGVTVSPSAGLLFVSNFASDTVSILNASTGAVVKSIKLSAFAVDPVGMSLSPTGGSVLVTTAGNSKGQGAEVVVISVKSLAATTVLSAGSAPVAVASDPVKGLAWVADEGDGAAVLIPLLLGVWDPADQPFMTDVGGTDLTALGPKPTESVWNEADNVAGAGAGGISSVFSMPHYQVGPGVINQFSTGAVCALKKGQGDCREIPDVAASADPLHGYVICYNAKGSGTSCPTVIGSGNTGWSTIGGTSAAAPLWAAAVALIDVEKGTLHRVGFINPPLYQLEAAHRGVLNDVTVGNNDYTTTNGGRYPATAGYDMASGLGTPIVSTIGSYLTAAAVPVVSKVAPATGSTKGGTTVTITGSGFTFASAVEFGSTAAEGFVVESNTKIVALSPAGKGAVAVRVVSSGGTSAKTAGAAFTY